MVLGLVVAQCGGGGGGAPALSAEHKSRGDLSNKTIVVTGASSGFGRGVSIELARRGANVVLASRRKEALEALAKECGDTALVVPCDVSKASQVKALAEAAVSKFGSIDIWINDAGVGAIGRFTDIPLEDQDRIVETNLIGVINGSHCALKQFQKQNKGILINVASIVGEIPLGYYATYSASKLGVVGLDDAIRAELKVEHRKSIRVCTVLPISTDTPFWNHAANYSGHNPDPPYLQNPGKVVTTIVKLVTAPKNEVRIGTTAKAASRLHQLFPKMIETAAARKINRTQINAATAKVNTTDGATLEPMSDAGRVLGDLQK